MRARKRTLRCVCYALCRCCACHGLRISCSVIRGMRDLYMSAHARVARCAMLDACGCDRAARVVRIDRIGPVARALRIARCLPPVASGVERDIACLMLRAWLL